MAEAAALNHGSEACRAVRRVKGTFNGKVVALLVQPLCTVHALPGLSAAFAPYSMYLPLSSTEHGSRSWIMSLRAALS